MPMTSSCRSATTRSTPSSSLRYCGTLVAVDENGTPTRKRHKISESHELVIGRNPDKCHWVFQDPFMSQKHLRVYTILYDDNNDDVNVEPLVYAEDLSRNGSHWNGSVMGKKNDAFLLTDGDRIRLSSRTSLIFQALSSSEEGQHFDIVQEREMQSFCSKYVLTDRLLGAGTFGQVFMAIEQSARTQLACKIVDLRRLGLAQERTAPSGRSKTFGKVGTTNELRAVKALAEQEKLQTPVQKKLDTYYREIEILSSISHPNIIALEKVLVTDNTLYIFQDLVTAGDLYSYVQARKHSLFEAEAAVIIRQVLIAIDFLHDRNIAHRDLKPENIMLTSLAIGARIVLTDFGSAKRILPMQRASTMAGSEEYAAPEMLNQKAKFFRKKVSGYTLATDLWSVGAISALLLAGFRPFDSSGGNHSSSLAEAGDLKLLEKSSRWRSLAERPKNFVRRLLVLEEYDRMSAKEALNHPWFSNDIHKSDFEELYQRTIKHWRPRVPNTPIVDFVQSKHIKYLKSPQNLLENAREPRTRLPWVVPVDPPHKPFTRRIHSQTGLWPKRRKTCEISEEMQKVIGQSSQLLTTSPSLEHVVMRDRSDVFKKSNGPRPIADNLKEVV